MLIRNAGPEDAEAISKLVLDASSDVKAQDFTEEGWGLLERTNTVEAVRTRFEGDSYFALICEYEGEIAGYIAMVGYQKIDHLFVYARFRKLGVARTLWEKAQSACQSAGSYDYWVKSSSYAQPVYQSFGFTNKGAQQESSGISFRLMVKGEPQVA